MIKKLIMALVLALGLIALQINLAPRKAECQLCFTGTCYNSSMCGGTGCVCLKFGMDLQGKCANIN